MVMFFIFRFIIVIWFKKFIRILRFKESIHIRFDHTEFDSEKSELVKAFVDLEIKEKPLLPLVIWENETLPGGKEDDTLYDNEIL